LAISYAAWRQGSWRRFLIGGAVTAGLVALIACWWFVRNAVLYDGDWFGLERFIQVLGYRVPPATVRQLWSERAGFMMAYWGLFGGVNVPLPGWIYTALNAALVLSGAGLLLGAARVAVDAVREFGFVGALRTLVADPGPHKVQLLLLALWPTVVFVSWAGWATRTWSSQGRLIFSAITAWSAWMAWGLGQLWPRSRRRGWTHARPVGAGLVALFMLGVAAWAPFGVIRPTYRAPVLAASDVPTPEHVLRADLGGQVRLLGYDMEGVGAAGDLRVRPGEALRLTLYWESQVEMDRDWSVFFHLLDSDLDLVLATRDRYPGQGLLATSQMASGQRWVDRYVVWVEETTYAPARALLEVGLYDLATGERPPILVEEGQAEVVDNALRFQPLAIEALPGDLPNPLAYRMEDKLALVGWDVTPRVVSAGDTLHLTLYWEGLASMSDDYQVSTQVVRTDQLKAAQVDSAPAGVPTSVWAKGERRVDLRELRIDPGAPPGGYDILVSVYGWEAAGTIKRLRLIDGQGYVLPGDSLTLGQVRVIQ
jgi:hypothetical protein